MRNLLRCSLLTFSAAALVAGCSSSNSEAPAEAHPANWYQLHRATATTSAFASECGGCHVVKDLPGPATPPSCFSDSVDGRVCHAGGPGQAPHPLDGSYLLGSVHGKVAKADLTFCQNCHSSNPTGGPGSNPRFNFGINNPTAPVPGTGCEQCHGVNHAHPALWAGPNSTFHYSAGNIQAACTLCHGVALTGGVGVSCQGCHAETAAFTLNCTSCHGLPPDGVTAEPVVAAGGGFLVNHTAVPLGSHDQCATCHGVKVTNPGPSGLTGTLNPSANYLAFNKTTDTLGDHWNGAINMSGPSALDPNNTSGLNAGTRYNSANFGCDLACHANDATHRLSDSNLPLAFGDYGSGQAPHAVGNSWLLLSQHATQAVNSAPGYCVACHTLTGGGSDPSCQSCHRVAPKMDLTTNGCSSCHNYPPDGVTPVAVRPNRPGKHGQHVTPAAAGGCSACHQGGGSNSLSHYDRTGVTPSYPAEVNFLAAYNAQSGLASYSVAALTCAKVSCHGGFTTPNWYTGALPLAATASTSNVYCRSCHVFGATEYNGFSSGEHDRHVNGFNYLCVNCHVTTVLQNGVGGVGPTHWSNLDTPAFELTAAATVGGDLVTSYDGTSCTASCHLNPAEAETW